LYWTGNYYFVIPFSIPAGTDIRISCEIQSVDENYVSDFSRYDFEYIDGETGYQSVLNQKPPQKDVKAIYIYKSNTSDFNEVVVRNIQLELGTVTTEYEPYKEQQTLVVSVPNGIGTDGFVCEDYAELHTYKPNTTITNDVGAVMSVEYEADTKAYIDNKFNELAATLTALTGV
jgi:hypothetical protein